MEYLWDDLFSRSWPVPHLPEKNDTIAKPGKNHPVKRWLYTPGSVTATAAEKGCFGRLSPFQGRAVKLQES